MKRREFISLLGGAAVAWPFAARAQQQGVPLVGFLSGTQVDNRRFEAFRQGLQESGYVEGRNIAIKYRSADGRFDQLPALAAALVANPAAVILTFTPAAAMAAKAATAAIPIVFVTGADPVELGLVSSLNRPGGNITGVSFLVTTLAAKRLELLRELAPSATVIGFLVNTANPTSEFQTRDAQSAALALGLRLVLQNASSEADINAAFASFAEQGVHAVMVAADAFLGTRNDQLAGLAARHAMPATYYLREAVAAGGLMSYGTSVTDALRLAAGYVGRILKGEKPGDLPVQQTVKFELAINLKTAKALGLTVPPIMQMTADEVIE
jgi:putative ABC transport system substrate-binding protein